MKELPPNEDSIQFTKVAKSGEKFEQALRALKDSHGIVQSDKVTIPQQTSEKWIPPKNVIKILVMGEGGRGSTAVLYRYVKGTFTAETSMTIGVQIHVKNITFNGLPYTLIFWDFAGHDRWRFVLPAYPRDTKGAIMMYDTTRRGTLDCFGGVSAFLTAIGILSMIRKI